MPSINLHAHTLINLSAHALFLSVSKLTEEKGVAIVSLVELTIDFLLSIINAVLTKKTRQYAQVHTNLHKLKFLL